MELHGAIIVGDFEKHDIMAVNDLAEVVLLVGIVALVELVKRSDLGDYLGDRLLPEGLDTLGQHDTTAPTSPAEVVVEGSNFGGVVVFFHGVLSSIGVVDHRATCPLPVLMVVGGRVPI